MKLVQYFKPLDKEFIIGITHYKIQISFHLISEGIGGLSSCINP